MKELWGRFSNIGIDELHMSDREIRRVRSLNQFNLILLTIVSVTFIYQFIYYQIIKQEFNINTYIMLFTYAPLTLSLYLNKRGLYSYSRCFFFFWHLITISLWSIAVGEHFGIHWTYLIFPILIMILFEKIKTQVLYLILTIAAFWSTYFSYQIFELVLSANINNYSNYIIYTNMFIMTFFICLFYKREINIAEANLNSKNYELEQFTRAASHDMKEPARSISTFSNLIREGYTKDLPDEAITYLDFIENASNRMLNLLRDLLNYATTGDLKEPMKKVDLNQVVSEATDNLAAQIKSRNAIIVLSDLPTVKGYKTYLTQMVQNLIANGIKFQPAGQQPVIKIFSEKNVDGIVKFSIVDNGIGIKKEHQKIIFENFKRLHNHSEYEGSGLGLATTKKILELHKAKINVESESGEGARFNIFFTE